MSVDEEYEVSHLPGHPLSYTTTRATLYFDNTELGTGTAFVMRYAGEYALVTNWHVVSGRSPIDGNCLSPTGGVPNRMTFHVTVSAPVPDEGPLAESLYFKPMDIQLYRDDDWEAPIWVTEKSDDNQSDYVGISLKGIVEELSDPVNGLRAIQAGRIVVKRDRPPKRRSNKVRSDDIQHFFPPVGRNVFILGYPSGIDYPNVFPIWKSATIASEPTVEVTSGGMRTSDVFFVDALTRGGMSGSPVVCLPVKGETYFTEDGGRIPITTDEPLLMGVYAGREGVTKNEAELALGRVWKVSAVERLLARLVASS